MNSIAAYFWLSTVLLKVEVPLIRERVTENW